MNKINTTIGLEIDTTNSQETVVRLMVDGKTKEYREVTGQSKSQNVLPLIEKALKELKLRVEDIDEIEVNTGPGSFTGTRVGVTIANALGWTLKIKVNGEEIALPKYAPSKFD